MVKVALLSSVTVRFCGDWLMVGGATTPAPLAEPGVGAEATQLTGSLPYCAEFRRCNDSPPPSTAPAGHGAES